MAAQAESYEDFVGQILRPTNLKNLKDPINYEKVSVLIYRNSQDDNEASDELEFENIYPFYTIADLKTKIYMTNDSKEEFHPQNQCLLLKTKDGFIHLQYLFDKQKSFDLKSPFTQVKSGNPNVNFVDLEGNPKKQDITNRDNMLLEDVLFKKQGDMSTVYTIHLFLYSDIYQAYPKAKPVSRLDWEGIFRVYFPLADKSREDGRLSDSVASYAPVRVQRFLERESSIEKLNELLTEGAPLRRPGEREKGESINFSSIKNLRFSWTTKNVIKDRKLYQPFRLESIFYDMPVSKLIPYIRYFSVTNSPISKIHVQGPLNIPTMEDPSILQKWVQESPIYPEQEFLSAKVLIRPGIGSVNPLYANLYIFQDENVMFAIQPNADTKSLSKQGDLFNLVEILNSAISSIPGLQPLPSSAIPMRSLYTPSNVHITDAYIILSLWLEKEDTVPITAKSLMAVLPYFRGFFQITSSPIKEQSPIAFLRYKIVNNFQTPSRDSQFLARISDLQKIQGVTSLPSLLRIYKEEFDVTDEVAHARVSAFISDITKYSLVNPETLDYTQKENPGVDIAIFGKHPYYTFHIYRVDSLIILQRIKTLLSLLISVSPDMFSESKHTADVLEEEEVEAIQAAEAKADLETQIEVQAENPLTSEADIKGEMKAIVSTQDDMDNAAIFDDGLGDFGGFGQENAVSEEPVPSAPAPVQSAPAPVQSAPAPVQSSYVPVPLASGSAMKNPKKAEKSEEDDDEITDSSQIKLQPARIYFRKRLQFYDKTLFSYSKTHPSLKKYPSMCAANALKQPTVMTEDEFERMKDIYNEDITSGRVRFVEYPVQKGKAGPIVKSSNTEFITTLRYGSNLNPGQANIYICSEYWCIRDEIVVLKDDFENKTVDRKGKPKDKKTCPFCRGGLIINREDSSGRNTVIERIARDKDSTTKKHLFINFLSKTPHPLGLYLPCCFIRDHPIDISDPAFAPLTNIPKEYAATEHVVPSLASDVMTDSSPFSQSSRSTKDDVKILPVDYNLALDAITKTYIVGSEKLPLELTKAGPQIGIVPKNVDVFFAQDSLGSRENRGLVIQDHTVWKIMVDNITNLPSASGFFRLAAENNKRNQPDSFLAATAPYFGKNSAASLKNQILSLVQPNLFLSLNYGNFLFDFYNSATPSPPSNVLREFAQKRFLIGNPLGVTAEAVIRAWKGYVGFEAFMKDTTRTKEFRHFSQLFSLPGLMYWVDSNGKTRNNGILFIVLEVSKEGSVEIRCPPYGVNKRHTDPKEGCDIAFILHYYSGVWEPLFYTHNNPSKKISENTLIFTRDTHADWPIIVKQRVEEYENMCHSSGLGIYTDSPDVESTTLIPLSNLMSLINEEIGVHAIMRDIYNHVSAVVFKKESTSELIVVPTVDDGTVYMTVPMEIEWKNFAKKLGKTSTVREFYETTLVPLLDDDKKKAAYKIVNILRLDKTEPHRDFVYALQLGGKIYVPVNKGEEEGQLESLIEGGEIPWYIDRKIVYGSLVPDAKLTVDYKDFEEIYQHLRFTFANWFALAPGNLKEQINKIIFFKGKQNINIPLYEKRQRLLLILENDIMSWLDSSIAVPERKPSLKRIDCRVTAEAQCKDRCVWKGKEDKCLLHVPENFDVGSNKLPARNLLVRKLIEELIRFPEKRRELITQDVGQYVKIREPFRSGSQYIVPEDLPAWSELLRMEWTKKEDYKYLEEYSSITPLIPEATVTATAPTATATAPTGPTASMTPEPLAEASSDDSQIPELVQKEAIRTSDESFLKAKFGSNFIFRYYKEDYMASVLKTFGLSVDEYRAIFDTLEEPIRDLEKAKIISRKLNLSLYILSYESGNPVPPTPIIVKLASIVNRRKKAEFIMIVQLPDGRLGYLTENVPGKETIALESLPNNIKAEINSVVTTLPITQ
jgi:hypothetical protein